MGGCSSSLSCTLYFTLSLYVARSGWLHDLKNPGEAFIKLGKRVCKHANFPPSEGTQT